MLRVELMLPDADETDVEATKERGRALIRSVVVEVYGEKETTT